MVIPMKTTPPHRGFTLLELIVMIGILAVLMGLMLPAVQRVRDAAARTSCQNNLRQIGLGLHSYHDTHGVLPPGTRPNGADFPFMNWLTRILPFIEQEAIWKQAVGAYAANYDFKYDPPHPLATVIPLYGCPADPRTSQVGFAYGGTLRVAFTSYLGVEGQNQTRKNGCLFLNSSIGLLEISDGTSNTLLVGERPPSTDEIFGWWYAGVGQSWDGSADALLGVRERNARFINVCPYGASAFGPGRFNNQCDVLHFWSPHLGGGAHFLLADGSVHFLTYSAGPLMPALASRNGGEAVSIPD